MSYGARMVLRVVIVLLALCAVAVVISYAVLRPVRATEPGSGVALPNPASAYCEEKGYRLELRTAADGSQYGICVFPDGSECEEWAFYRGECDPAGTPTEAVRPTIALNPAAGSPGQAIQVTGSGFAPGASVALRLGVPNAGLSKQNLATAVADAQGAFEAELALPAVWPGAQMLIVERELVIAAVDEVQSYTLAVAPFTNTTGQ